MKISRFLSPLLCGTLLAAPLLLPAPDANAAILAQYSFDGNSLDSSDSDARTDATIFGEGPFVISDFDARGNPNPSRFVSFPAIFPQSRQDALDFDYYFNFQVAANAGNQFSLSNLEFQTDVGPSSMGDNGSFFVQADTGSAGTFSDISPTFTQASTDAANFLPRTTFDLGGAGFFTRPVEFRIYVFSNGGFADGGLRLDNITLNGDSQAAVAPVPELSTGLLMLLGGAMLLVLWRRKPGFSFGAMTPGATFPLFK